MDAKTNLKSRLPSRHVTEGPSRAPHRSYYYAMGLTTQQIHQPFVGVASCWNEAAPCNIALMRQAQAVKKGVASAGGTPREFCTITVTDGIAMGHEGMKSSLPSREVIADSIELVARGNGFDGLVVLVGCDKTIPGGIMALARLDIPGVALYGGSIAPGQFHGHEVTVQDVFAIRGRGTVATGRVESGQLRVGDEVRINDTFAVTVDGIEAFRKQLNEAGVGDNIGVLFKKLEKSQLNRGDVLTSGVTVY